MSKDLNAEPLSEADIAWLRRRFGGVPAESGHPQNGTLEGVIARLLATLDRAGRMGFRDALIIAMVAAGFDGDDNPGESPSHALISWADAIIEELPRWNTLSVRTTGAEYRASDPGNVWVRMSEEDYAKLIAK